MSRLFCQLWKGNSLTAKFGSTVAGGGEEEEEAEEEEGGGGRRSCDPTQSADQSATDAGDARRARITAEQQR